MKLANLSIFFKTPAVRATAWVFVGEGIIFGTWAASVPYFKQKFGLDEAELGMLLLCLPFGVMLTNPFTVRLLHKFGSAKATWGALAVAAVLFIPPFIMSNIWATGLTLAAVGASLACTNVFMNTCASQLEQYGGLRIMSTCHGVWSFGGMLGAAVVGVVTSWGVPHLWYVCGLAALLLLVAFQIRPALAGVPEDPHAADVPPEKPSVFVKPNRALWILIIISLCTNLTEGTMADWSAVYMREVVRSKEAMVGWGFAAYAFFMAGGRLLGDELIARFGNKKILTTGGFIVAAGLLLSAIFPNTAAVLVGFAMVGAGVSLGAPILYAASAKVPGMAKGAGLATMNNFAMAGFLSGPALIGFLAKAFSLPVAFMVVAATAGIWVWQSRKVD